ncbi:MAG: hypothetical protein HEQ21_08390 [Blastomonas sp.]|uniref:hypothetical protein n=1 Tax=Blastomonas sp. TaxID=1909299 RepID=UPI00258CE9A5|nr:hypothetical protein [Blastomonas sp.]MCO5792824.1 hypothetical protein [Blastomonas sp.]
MDLAKRLGAEDGVSRPQKFAIYLPDRDADNQPVLNMGRWLDEAVTLMTEINGGCTRLPSSRGAWLNKKTNKTIIEDTAVIYSYLFDPEMFEERFDEIVEFLYEYGRETNQDSVMAEFSGWTSAHGDYVSEAYFIPSSVYMTDSMS